MSWRRCKLATAAALASIAAGVAAEAHADHKGDSDTPVLAGVVPGGGKFYDDRQSGQCASTDWVCYMSLTADVHFNDAPLAAYVSGGRDKWNAEDTTVFFDLRGDQNSAYDVHFKSSDLPSGLFGLTHWADYHNNNCGDAADCHDPDGIPAHQPERWWYVYIELDKNEMNLRLNTLDKRTAIVAHEMGHALGLAHHPNSNCEGGPGAATIMYVPCIQSGIYTTPQNPDTCELNHASSPLMYGDDPNRTLHTCP